MQGECNSKAGKQSFTGLDTAEPQLILYKDNANERKESLLLFSRVLLILCKTSAAMDNIPYLNDATRLARLHECMENRADVCSSGGVVSDFPQRMYDGFINFGIGLIVCHEGDFDFILSDKTYTAKHGETVFMTEHTYFRIVRKSRQLQASIIIYKTEPIRYVIGTIVQSVQIYARMSPELPCVWSTGCENDISRYISLIGNDAPQPEKHVCRKRAEDASHVAHIPLVQNLQQQVLRGRLVQRTPDRGVSQTHTAHRTALHD